VATLPIYRSFALYVLSDNLLQLPKMRAERRTIIQNSLAHTELPAENNFKLYNGI
jgi:hypothetical protein